MANIIDTKCTVSHKWNVQIRITDYHLLLHRIIYITVARGLFIIIYRRIGYKNIGTSQICTENEKGK